MVDSFKLIWLANMLLNVIQYGKSKNYLSFLLTDWLNIFFKKDKSLYDIMVQHQRPCGTQSGHFWRRAMWHIKHIRVGSQEWLMLQAQSDNSQPFVGLCWYFLSTAFHFCTLFTVPCVVSASICSQITMFLRIIKPVNYLLWDAIK